MTNDSEGVLAPQIAMVLLGKAFPAHSGAVGEVLSKA